MAEDTTTQSRISEYVQTMDNTIEADDYLTYIINEVIDRVLVYTNRYKYVDEDNPDVYTTKAIPLKLERIIARAVVSVYHNTREILGSSDNKAIKSISDNGQSISYGEEAKDFLVNSSDVEMFSAIVPLLDNFRVPIIVENPCNFSQPNKGNFLR